MFGQYALPHGAGRGYLEEGRRCYTDLYNALIGTSDRMETLLSEGKRTREGRERSECVGLLCEECVCSIYCVVLCSGASHTTTRCILTCVFPSPPSLLRKGFELESVCRAWATTLHEKKKITSQETTIRMQQVDILRAAEGMYRVNTTLYYRTTREGVQT